MLAIRTLCVDDWSLWRDLRLQALQEAADAFSSTLADWQGAGDSEQKWRDRLANVALNLVAVVDGHPGGMISATRPDKQGQVEILSMWIAPWTRGRRVGDAFISEVLRWASDQQATHLILKVVVGNEPAIALYRRNGFAENGWGDVLPDGRREQVMTRELPQHGSR